jgi:type II secretory pathway pseudopilin PulG
MERALQSAIRVAREHTDRRRGRDGFALVEVLVAAGLLVAVAVGLSQVSAAAIRASHAARARTFAAVLASQKMEQLRSLKWSRARIGTPAVLVSASDTSTDLSRDPPTDDGRGLLPSPAGTLESNVPFYVDYLDGSGAWAARGARPPATAVYVRRWAVRPLESHPDDILVLQVVVNTTSFATAHESRLVSVLTRRP